MVSTPQPVDDPRSPAGLREDAAGIEQALAEPRRQLAALAQHGSEHILAEVTLGAGPPLRLTVTRSALLADLQRMVGRLDDVATTLRAEAHARERHGDRVWSGFTAAIPTQRPRREG